MNQSNAKGFEGENAEEGSKRKGESLGESNEEEGERRRDERGSRKGERRRRGGRERPVLERRGGDPPGEWVDRNRREIRECGRASEQIRRWKGVAAITSPG